MKHSLYLQCIRQKKEKCVCLTKEKGDRLRIFCISVAGLRELEEPTKEACNFNLFLDWTHCLVKLQPGARGHLHIISAHIEIYSAPPFSSENNLFSFFPLFVEWMQMLHLSPCCKSFFIQALVTTVSSCLGSTKFDSYKRQININQFTWTKNVSHHLHSLTPVESSR